LSFISFLIGADICNDNIHECRKIRQKNFRDYIINLVNKKMLTYPEFFGLSFLDDILKNEFWKSFAETNNINDILKSLKEFLENDKKQTEDIEPVYVEERYKILQASIDNNE
jgi:hypothetical protein